jgi:GntR family histidine utilization transcriptional repressor
MSKVIPAYQQIKEAILDNIHSGLWQAGQAIPPELTLAEQFGVSRMTVNRALKELSEERVLERRQGSGTFVAQQHFNHTFVEVRNIAHDIQADNHRYQAVMLDKQLLNFSDLPSLVQRQFLLPKLTPIQNVVAVRIVHFADDIPLQLEERWVDAQLAPEFFDQDFNQVNTSDYLITHVPLEGGEYTISAQAADTSVAEALGIKPQEPTLLLNRVTFSQGRVVTVVNMWHVGSRYQFHGRL